MRRFVVFVLQAVQVLGVLVEDRRGDRALAWDAPAREGERHRTAQRNPLFRPLCRPVTERFKRDLPEIEIVAFFKQMPPDLRKKLGYKPASSEWWYKLTTFLEEKEAWSLAEAAYRKAVELDPAKAHPWAFLGTLLAKIGRSAEAEAAYRNRTRP
jgi:tetratricopeptide (TPR) repeat protein